MKDKYCSLCKEKFANGEIVAASLDGRYHYISRDLDEIPEDCTIKRAMSSDGIRIIKKAVYYNGKFYNINKLNNLRGCLTLNSRKNGEIFEGDLESLTKKRLWFF
jgi:hypothetical protein